MILTVTPNSAIDRVIFVRDFHLGHKSGADGDVFTPAGKGVGASLTIHELGGATLASGLAAGNNGRLHRAMLDEIGIAHDFVEADGETRMAIVLVDLEAVRQSTISVPTLLAKPDHLARLSGVLERHASEAWGVAFGGSLPIGLPSDAYAELVRKARRMGLYTLLDASGEPLCRGVSGLPHVLKVNADELSILEPRIGSWLHEGAGGIEQTGAHLQERIGEWAADAVIVTLGHRGVLAVTPDGTVLARPPRVTVVNTAGAGDALTGGLMLMRSQGASWADALALGTAAAASVVMNEGTGVCKREQVAELLPQVHIEG
jgi:tagatose 6-phosphate kinase